MAKYLDQTGAQHFAEAIMSSTKTINGQSIWGSGNIEAGDGGIITDTYETIFGLKTSGLLVPGQLYAINNYSNIQYGDAVINTDDSGYNWRVILRALSNNTFAKNGWLIALEDSNEFYEISYIFGNDPKIPYLRWVNRSNNKGAIIWMKDLNGNEAYFDFRSKGGFRHASFSSPVFDNCRNCKIYPVHTGSISVTVKSSNIFRGYLTNCNDIYIEVPTAQVSNNPIQLTNVSRSNIIKSSNICITCDSSTSSLSTPNANINIVNSNYVYIYEGANIDIRNSSYIRLVPSPTIRLNDLGKMSDIKIDTCTYIGTKRGESWNGSQDFDNYANCTPLLLSRCSFERCSLYLLSDWTDSEYSILHNLYVQPCSKIYISGNCNKTLQNLKFDCSNIESAGISPVYNYFNIDLAKCEDYGEYRIKIGSVGNWIKWQDGNWVNSSISKQIF